jgi:hypothetical protein
MGTDIHPLVEVRRKGQWHTHQPKTPCSYYYDYKYDPVTQQRVPTLDANGEKIRSKWDTCKYRLPDYFSDRNYSMFSVLADIRNDGSIPAMTRNRGFPSDTAPGSASYVDPENVDHSPGYVTLTEMLAYDWSMMIESSGRISAQQYMTLRGTGKSPDSWYGWASGRVTVTAAQYEQMLEPVYDVYANEIAPNSLKPGVNYDIDYTWHEFLVEQVPQLVKVMNYLTSIIPKGGTSDDVRLLFYFDS